MVYKKKLTVLSSIVAALALVYVLCIIFEPERTNSRSAGYTWLDPKMTGQIDKIVINNSGARTELVRKNNEWFVSHNGKEYPARQFRVEDFIGAFTRRASYPVRSSSPASHERLGLTETSASRVTITDGAGLPLLDLLAGQTDVTGQDVFLRKQGQNEVRSGENKFSAYITSPRSSWYNLRLFPESENGKLDVDGIQRLTVYRSAESGAAPEVYTRSNREWTISGLSLTAPDPGKVDAYIRGILNTEGDDFDETINAADPVFGDSRLVLELGNGEIKTVRLGPPDETNRRFALVSGSSFVYSIPGWTAQRLFGNAADFEKQDS
ncbi:MAG: DUF4340 domain-containing protein [Treponema sp.]|jgi:hypothetical protein|nr:DUF4340 domain-containing protein [Treponema sp.]